MGIRIYSKFAKELLLAEEKACAKLISSGTIYNIFVECCRAKNTPHNQVFLAKDKKIIVGWAVIKQNNRKEWQFMVYIKRAYRRQGIGTRLYKRARKLTKVKDGNITVYRTDRPNRKFFDSIRGPTT